MTLGGLLTRVRAASSKPRWTLCFLSTPPHVIRPNHKLNTKQETLRNCRGHGHVSPHPLSSATATHVSRRNTAAMVYIRQDKLPKLKEYKYQGVDHSLVSRYVLKPFYTHVVIKCFPMWMA